MKIFLPFVLAATLALAACGDSEDTATQTPPPAATTPAQPESEAARESREAMDAIGDAGRATSDAVGAAARDLQERAGPAMERARQEGAEALEGARQGLNDLTRGAACQTARSANDAEGIAANC